MAITDRTYEESEETILTVWELRGCRRRARIDNARREDAVLCSAR